PLASSDSLITSGQSVVRQFREVRRGCSGALSRTTGEKPVDAGPLADQSLDLAPAEAVTADSPERVPSAASASQPWLNVLGSRHFLDWLAEQRLSLAFTTYQTGKMFCVGRKPEHALAVFERTFNYCMGLWASPDAQTLWLSSRYQLWRFEKAPAEAVPYVPAGSTEEPMRPTWS